MTPANDAQMCWTSLLKPNKTVYTSNHLAYGGHPQWTVHTV
jgi:hypothetical protein